MKHLYIFILATMLGLSVLTTIHAKQINKDPSRQAGSNAKFESFPQLFGDIDINIVEKFKSKSVPTDFNKKENDEQTADLASSVAINIEFISVGKFPFISHQLYVKGTDQDGNEVSISILGHGDDSTSSFIVNDCTNLATVAHGTSKVFKAFMQHEDSTDVYYNFGQWHMFNLVDYDSNSKSYIYNDDKISQFACILTSTFDQ